MDIFEPHLNIKKEVRFAEGFVKATSSCDENFGDTFGGIIKSGQWGWITKGSRLCITSLRSGQSISKYDFDASNGFGVCIITCVSEIQIPYLKDTVIAIGIQYTGSPGGLIVIYSIEESRIICCIDLKHKITCCRFISLEVSHHTILQNMNGCLAVGTDGGSVLLVDLNLRNAEVPALKEDAGISIAPCHIVDYSMSLLHLHRHFQHCQQEEVHFGIQLEVLENAEFIQSLLPIDLVLGLAVGLADGRLVLYDLTDMQVFYVAPPQERSSPLVKMSSMEPPDDPRPCVYIWAFHENYQNSMAVMHSLMYEKRVVTENGFCYFENFQVSSVRLQLPLNCPKSVPTACQAISKAPSHGNEETISLCALVWKQEQELQTEVLLFDINQWYKEEMPYVGDWREDPSYLASFVLPGFCCLDMYFDPNTISLFNSIQRPEEHFYPISLSFDSIGLGEKGCLHLNWPGVQNRVVNVLRSQGSLALLDPNPIFLEVLNTRLLPQFSGLNYKATFSLKAKRETLLSVAIENNCNGLLKECAKNWSDGSHQGSSLSEGLSLSTLTDWLWARASSIKERCNKLCKVLFDHSGYTLDHREKQELCFISKQLRTLADLSSDIISKYGENIPSDVLSTLESQGNSIRMASDYQEILLWLLNIGLLPEASLSTNHRRDMELNLVPYPYESLHCFYEKRRIELMRYSSRKARSCYLLFIDSFLEHSFKGNALRDSWQESGGDGLYPPTSVQAMLRIMLISDVSFENKCALFLYFFLDLNMAIEDKRYEPIVQNFIKFPSVFKLSASLIKQIQAFWNLDHCHFQAAVDEFISPFNKDHICPQWQIELFIASLLNQYESNLALRVLEAKSLPISPLLQLNTYLANDLISEAFHFARSEKDEELLKFFFSRCLLMKKFGVIRDLALTEGEGKIVQSLLKSSKNRNAEDLTFVYLLQKYKYIEAVGYQDELSKGRDFQRAVDDLSKGRNNQTAVDIDTSALVLSAYHTTMTPVTKNISDVYLKIKNKIKKKETEQSSPYPLSCQLIKQNASDLLGGIYHSSALGTHFASHYWDQKKFEGNGNALQQPANAPFLRSPQISSLFCDYEPREIISYPEPFKPAQKRRLDNSPVDSEKISKILENPKKRRKIYDRYDFELSTSDNLLTHFKNSTTYNQDVSTLTKIIKKTPSRESSLFLQTPFVKNTSADDASSQIPQKSGPALPGILKVTQPKTSVDETDQFRSAYEEPEKRKDSEEEKSIRFVLPLDESLEQNSEQNLSMKDQDALSQSPEKLQQPESLISLRSTISHNSLLALSKNELQNILDKVHNESKQKSLLKPTSAIESISTIFKPQSREFSPESSNATSKQQQFNLCSKEESRSGPTPRKSIKSTINYSSCPQLSKNELQDILDKVKNEQSKHGSILETNSNFESNSIILKSTPFIVSPKSTDILKVIEPEENLEIAAKTNQRQSRSPSSKNKRTTISLSNVASSEPESNLCSIDFTAVKSEGQLKNSNISDFACFSNLESSPKVKFPKRALSESSDSQSNDSIQRGRKKLRGRASIHNSDEDLCDYKTKTTSSKQEKIYNTVLQETKTIYSTDTIIDFKPHTSSSKVCTSVSMFNEQSIKPVTVIETESKIYSEKSPLKVTFSEKTTVIDELTYFPTMEVPQNITEASSVTLQSIEKQNMLDTTVEMTLGDTMGFEEDNLDHQPTTSENSSSVDTFDKLEDQHELNEFDVDEKDNEELDDDDSSSSIILLSSRSSSRSDSRNQDFKSNEFESDNDVPQRHISIDDKDAYFEESCDDNDDDDDEDESVEIIESDGSEDPSNFFSNKSRDATSTSTSSLLASDVISENSSHCNILLEDTIIAKNYRESSNSGILTAPKKFKSTESSQREDVEVACSVEQKSNDTKESIEPELKLSVTSESGNEYQTIDVTFEEDTDANKNPCQTDHDVACPPDNDDIAIEEPILIKPNNPITEIFVNQRNKPIETDKQIEVELEELPPHDVEKRTEKETHMSENVDSKTEQEQSTVQKYEENMEIENTVVICEETNLEPSDDGQFIPKHSGTEQIQIATSDEPQTIAENSEIEENSTIENEKVNCIEEEDINENDKLESVSTIETDTNKEICGSELQSVEIGKTQNTENKIDSTEGIENEKSDQAKYIQSEVVETEMSSSKEFAKKRIVEAESTVSTDIAIANKDSVDEEKEQNVQEYVESTHKLRRKSFSKNLPSEIVVVATPPSRRLSRRSSISSLQNIAEVESNDNTKTTISNEDSVNEEKQKQSVEYLESTPKLRNRRSTSFSKNITSETDVAASPSTRRLSRGGSMPPSTGNQIVTRRRSLLVDNLDEITTPDSPSCRTRSKIRSDSIDGGESVESSSVSNVKRSRVPSISSLNSIEQPLTPKTKRRSRMSVDNELVSTPKAARTTEPSTPIKTPRRLSVSKKSSPADDTSPTEIKPRALKGASKSPQTEPETLQTDNYTQSRRLTRTQLAAMERNLALSKQPIILPIIKRRRGSTATDVDSPPDVKESDNESSNSSRISHISNSTTGRRVTRSLALREGIADDLLSIASSTDSNKRKRRNVNEQFSPIAGLKAIPEEVPSDSESSLKNSETGKRPTRHKK